MADYNPTVGECIRQWQHNREFISTIAPKYFDWIITATLYTAMHAIESLLIADRAPNHATHGQRHQILQGNPRYASAIYPPYKVIYEMAHATRYSANPHRWLRYEHIDAIVFTRCLYPVEEEVRRLITSKQIFPAADKIVLRKE